MIEKCFDKKIEDHSFKMNDKYGNAYSVVLTGNRVYLPNTSSTSGYGSDNWLFLCRYNNKCGILEFEAESGATWWILYTITDLDYNRLARRLATKKRWTKVLCSVDKDDKILFINPIDVEQVKCLLPDGCRAFRFTDKNYLGFVDKKITENNIRQ